MCENIDQETAPFHVANGNSEVPEVLGRRRDEAEGRGAARVPGNHVLRAGLGFLFFLSQMLLNEGILPNECSFSPSSAVSVP